MIINEKFKTGAIEPYKSEVLVPLGRYALEKRYGNLLLDIDDRACRSVYLTFV